jgi:hypothetical protein
MFLIVSLGPEVRNSPFVPSWRGLDPSIGVRHAA